MALAEFKFAICCATVIRTHALLNYYWRICNLVDHQIKSWPKFPSIQYIQTLQQSP